jgi:GNAT superfamily N-acetyltransferase
MEEIIIQDGFDNMDFVKVTQMLATAYWSPGIGIDEVKKGAQHSAVAVGAFLKDKGQIGYARVISDKTRFAYICDVFVDEDHRGKGIGQKLIQHIFTHSELKSIYQWLLITKDAHGVYAKAGFEPLINPSSWMEIRKARPSDK